MISFRSSSRLRLAAILLCIVFPIATAVMGAPRRASIAPEELEFFEKKIRPVLANSCYECHSEEKDAMKGDLVLDTRDGIRAGGERGPAVVPRNLDDSILLRAIRQEGRLRMPPDNRGGPLPDDVIADFEKWISMGAPDPRNSASVGGAASSRPEREVDWDKEREFWAYKRPEPTPAPTVTDAEWPYSDIDRFVLAKQEERGIRPVADADTRSLVRRVYYDLTGLPPTPEELETFASDDSPDAFERLVDRLIASERFGEKWGRHWLDVARYGESTGLDRNLNYPYAFRYRNYVIDALNKDTPYDRFILEQLAGDLLPARNQEHRDELTIATGFLAVGPKGMNETRPKYFKWNVVDDQIDVTTRGFLGLTVSCSRCHDHKFDPIPTRDYHALAGIFSSSETLHGTVRGRGNRRPSLLVGLAGNPDRPVLFGNGPTPNNTRNTNAFFNLGSRTNGPAAGTNAARARAPRTRSTNSEPVERVPARGPYAMAVRDLDEPVDAPLYFRGDLSKPRGIVPRGYLRILSLPGAPAIPEDSSGRLQLAQWIIHPDNPLTARVMVNRAWQHLFGEGIVGTPDNFGELGSRPTHPELLDHLALKFVIEQRWSVKQLVRSLVLTRTYRLGTQVDARANEIDPENTLLWRATPRRLTAEALRDTILASSGRLDLERPETSVTAEFGDGYYGDNIWPDDFPAEYLKRSVYLPVPRDLVPESLALFDFPNPSLITARRENTISPSQALFLMNNPFVQTEALHLARRVLLERGGSDTDRLREIYRIALLREPKTEEIARAREFIVNQVRTFAESDPGWHDAEGSDVEPTVLLVPSQSVRADGRPAEIVRRTRQHIAAPEPASPRESAWTLLTQAVFASAEFRYLD
ncbi:MAG: PSD1 domain-containing protein [Verrucomicrobiae bacterium]|nr:PSD1 domain-containing protein [Verrucomicrobiae bacterium]